MDWINLLATAACFILLLVILGRLEAIQIQLRRIEDRPPTIKRRGRSIF